MPDDRSTPAVIPNWAREGRGQWTNTGRKRPTFATPPRAGQESVWDYPRPPALVEDAREVTVQIAGVLIARTRRAWRILETASPPTFYVPASEVAMEHLRRGQGSSRCEWKGTAGYWDYCGPGSPVALVAWSYEQPFAEFEAVRGCLAFYPARAECRVDGERVRPQPGSFYGGWVTSEIVGPFKGEKGSTGW